MRAFLYNQAQEGSLANEEEGECAWLLQSAQ